MPEDLWARSGMCPAESAVMLAATSKRVRGLLGRMQRRLPAAVKVRGDASMESVAGGLPRLQAWCSVVRLDASGLRMGTGGVRMLAGVLGQCSSLATLNLDGNKIDDDEMVLLRDSWLGLFLWRTDSGLRKGPGLILHHPCNPRVLFHGNAV